MVDIFSEIEKLPPLEDNLRPVQDYCMGFCYDPLAGLKVRSD
jgi:hypothetical protein